MIPSIWLYDLISVCYSFCYDMIQFSLICSVGYDMMLDMIWFVLFLCPSFYPTHGGTMGVSLKHQWHDTFCGGVIDPRRPHLSDILCVHFDIMICMICFVGDVWMHPRLVRLCWIIVGWGWVCALHFPTLEARDSIWYLEVSLLCACRICWICDYGRRPIWVSR